MCVAVPGRVVEIAEDGRALVDFMGVRRAVALDLLDGVSSGEYVLVHAGFAISLVDEEEAKKTWDVIEQINKLQDESSDSSG